MNAVMRPCFHGLWIHTDFKQPLLPPKVGQLAMRPIKEEPHAWAEKFSEEYTDESNSVCSCRKVWKEWIIYFFFCTSVVIPNKKFYWMNQNSSLKNCFQSNNEVLRAKQRAVMSQSPKISGKALSEASCCPETLVSTKKGATFPRIKAQSFDMHGKNRGSTKCPLRLWTNSWTFLSTIFLIWKKE